jgi:hyperosmotically inducible periplasmic protein
MRTDVLVFLLVPLAIGCGDRSKSDLSTKDQPRQSAAVEADNTGRNVRDRGGETKTPGDQSESEADRKITQSIRQAVSADESLSTNGKNVKIVTTDGAVTLRGPVKSEKEKVDIGAKAKQIAGVKKVDNQLEIAN